MNMVEYLKNITDLSPYIGTPPFCGVRYNPLKLTRDRFESLAPFVLSPCEFNGDGYRVDGEISGTHPLHMAGGYYIQEPSAMSAVTALELVSSDRVLDVCAAPGSKSTAIAAHCELLVANEINASRARTLIGNIERMGISNTMVTSSDSARLGNALSGFFDKVLVDSPCSGEGMFRKHPEILNDWSPELVQMCAERSRAIIQNAAAAVAPGGRLVYSTCTYNSIENEEVILDFLDKNPEFEPADTGFSFGEPGLLGLSQARRIFIKNGGEGHFVCALINRGTNPAKRQKTFRGSAKTDFAEGILRAPLEFHAKNPFTVIEHEGARYALHRDMPCPEGVRIMRAGVKLGCQVSKTFRPDHNLFTAASTDCVQRLDCDDDAAYRFMRGEELAAAGLGGYCAVCHSGLVLGFGKASGGVLKNHFPKGLRLLSQP